MRPSGSLWSSAMLCLGVLSFGTPAFATEGRVIDERTGKPIPNAEVTILGRPGVVYTNADGRFTWKPDPAPPFEILVVGDHAPPLWSRQGRGLFVPGAVSWFRLSPKAP